MGVVVTSRVPRGGSVGWLVYTTADGGRERAAEYLSDLGDPYSTARQIEAFMAGTRRQCEALSVVHSFPLTELQPDNPDHVRWATELTYEAAKRVSRHAPVVCVAHTDAKGGHLHVHALIINHDTDTGKAARDNWMHWSVRKKVNAVCTEAGLGVPLPQPVASTSPHLGNTSPEDTLPVDTCATRQEVRQYLREQIDMAILAEGVRTLDDVIRVLEQRGVNTERLCDTGHGETLTFAAVDTNGSVIRNTRTSRRGKKSRIKVAQKSSSLGEVYSAAGITHQIAAVAAMRKEEERNYHARNRQVEEFPTSTESPENNGGRTDFAREREHTDDTGTAESARGTESVHAVETRQRVDERGGIGEQSILPSEPQESVLGRPSPGPGAVEFDRSEQERGTNELEHLRNRTGDDNSVMDRNPQGRNNRRDHDDRAGNRRLSVRRQAAADFHAAAQRQRDERQLG